MSWIPNGEVYCTVEKLYDSRENYAARCTKKQRCSAWNNEKIIIVIQRETEMIRHNSSYTPTNRLSRAHKDMNYTVMRIT